MATAVKAYVTTAEYLRESYQPDCDLVRGEVQERNLGELEHAQMQLAIGHWFLRHAAEWGIIPAVEVRIRIGPDCYRIADVCVLSRSAPRESVLTTAPLLVVEVLSPDDRISRYRERLDDYGRMGIKAIWVIDPRSRACFDCSSGDWICSERLQVPGSPIYLSPNELELASFE